MRRKLPSPALLAFALLSPMAVMAQDHGAHGHHQQPAPVRDTPMQHHHRPDVAADAPREPIPEITDEDRAAAFPNLAHHMEHAPALNWKVLFNRLEVHDGDHGSGQAWEGVAWVGNDTDRLWMRTEGERTGGTTASADLELLYGRSLSPWWDAVVGVRHDFTPGDGRNWAAVGIQGMAPYRFEVSATAYVGDDGHTAAALEVEYDMLLTNRLILQPLVELKVHGKDDPARAIGSGLGSVEAGLRLRYEVSRRFAPYVGYAWSRAYGRTAEMRENAGESSREDAWVAGIRFWF